jgi:hypothetical protein
MSSLIDWYDPALWNDPKRVGDLTVDRSTLVPPFNGGLLHFIYWATYETAGRQYMHNLVPSAQQSEQRVRDQLATKLAEFGVDGQQRDVCVEVHIAGVRWVAKYNERNAAVAAGASDAELARLSDEMDAAEGHVKQQVAAITWFLWEAATGPLFPLPW